ncbi:MAG: hypothetical protein QHH80_08025 [Anaerolineae bacterium]|nr:hypothetical protein [Anaerolineae bacterium]
MRKFLAGLLALVFVGGFALGVIGWAALDALFSPDTYTGIIRNPRFVSVATDLAREQVSSRLLGLGRVLGPLFTADDADWVAEQIIAGPWITAQMERWLEVLFDSLKSNSPQPQLILSLAELKREVPSLAETLLARKLRQLPPCTLERVAQALVALLNGSEIPACLPPNFDVDGFVRSDIFNLRDRMAEEIWSVPDSVDILSLDEGESAASLAEGLNQIRQARLDARHYLTLLGVALLGLFLLIGLLRLKPARALLQWWGWTLLLGGGLALVGFGMVYAARGALWQWMATSPNGALPAGVAQMAQAAFDGILAAVWSRVLLLGGAGAGAGLVLAALSFALPRGQQHA